MRQDTTGQPLLIAVGCEQTLTLTAEVAGQPVTWSERRLLVRSHSYAAAQSRGLMRRLEAAELALADVLRVQHGKRRPTTPTELATAVETILARYRVAGLLEVRTQAHAHTRTIRAYREREAREETTYDLHLTSALDPVALAATEARLGWRVYVTNRPAEQLSIEQAVLAYRDEYLIERSLGRLKGAPLSLCPMYLSRDDHVCGLIRLLTLGVRVLECTGVCHSAAAG